MTKVYTVHWESGQYSDYCYAMYGIFSSREKAVAYIESIKVKARQTDYGGWMKVGSLDYPRGTDIVVKPTTTDEITFEFVGPNGYHVDFDMGSTRTYYVTEYEVDAECRDM